MTIVQAQLYSSIQELLTANGFSIDYERGWFVKPTSNDRMLVILFSELAGHTVKTFYEKAEHNGWLRGLASSPAPNQAPEYQFSPDQVFLRAGQ
ncbi:MAG: hypothetical protein AB7G75_15720 [Candidatus Binatia bacterium]